MIDQYFGMKELYEVVLRAKSPMQFGDRYVEADEPILYFDNVNMSLLTEQNRPIMAKGGWANMPRIIWDERTEVAFQMTEGVLSSTGMGIVFGANVVSKTENDSILVHKKEGPKPCRKDNIIHLNHIPDTTKKIFIFEYDRKAIQKKVYGQFINNNKQEVALFDDKKCETVVKNNKEYVIDYYYKYEDEALFYAIQKERFNGLFTLEGKFYSKDENEGKNYTNIIYMPKVRVVSNINLRLGEMADPTVSTFNILGLPETVGENKNLIVEITRLNGDEDTDI